MYWNRKASVYVLDDDEIFLFLEFYANAEKSRDSVRAAKFDSRCDVMLSAPTGQRVVFTLFINYADCIRASSSSCRDSYKLPTTGYKQQRYITQQGRQYPTFPDLPEPSQTPALNLTQRTTTTDERNRTNCQSSREHLEEVQVRIVQEKDTLEGHQRSQEHAMRRGG